MKTCNVFTSNLSKQIKSSSNLFTLFDSMKNIKVNGSFFQVRNCTAGIPGSGAGKGGGAGGSVRESGGSLGQYGAAQEEGYFYKKQKEQLKKIKKKLDSGESLDMTQKKEEK